MDNLYPVGHLSLLSPDEILKVAKFQDVRTERNKRLLLCLLPSADDVQTSPAQVHGCKGTTKNANAQILRVKKSVSFGMKSKRNIISSS